MNNREQIKQHLQDLIKQLSGYPESYYLYKEYQDRISHYKRMIDKL